MALDELGQLVDPYGGARDIASKTLRHVSEAFAEDPLRVLRLARSRRASPNSAVAPETMALCQMVDEGEI
jgi:tRNA nucleotidyltransferase (CCA-adding enzyme)